MRMFLFAGVAALLAGCTTMAGVQDKPATFTVSAAKPTSAVEECLALGLSRFGTPTIIHSERRTIFVYGQPNPAFTLTIIDSGSTRLIEARRGIGPVKKLKPTVERCA